MHAGLNPQLTVNPKPQDFESTACLDLGEAVDLGLPRPGRRWNGVGSRVWGLGVRVGL